MEERKGFGSNFGFLMAAVGSAVGLGNIWGFPNKMGASGGFTFLLIYLVLAVCCGFIVMVGELAIGRKTGKGAVAAYHALSKKFKWMGWMGILSAFFILFFYCALGGYCIKYVVLNVGDLFGAGFGSNGMTGAEIFGAFMSNPAESIIYGLIFVAITMVIVMGGIGGGIEKVCSIGMPCLFVALIICIIRALTLPGAVDGLKYMFVPGWAVANGVIAEAPSFFNVLSTAGGQMFFSLSLAMGVMITYGSYLDKKENLVKNAAVIVFADTAVALMAGLAVIPAAVATYGPSAALSGPKLLFITLQDVFQTMGSVGSLFGVIFYLLVLVAAISSAISLVEVVVTFFMDRAAAKGKTGSRSRVVLLVCLAIMVEATIVAVDGLGSNGVWVPFQNSLGVVGSFNDCWLDFMDCLSEGLAMPLGALLMSIMVRWEIGSKTVLEEIHQGNSVKWVDGFLTFCLMFVVPLAMAFILGGQIGDYFSTSERSMYGVGYGVGAFVVVAAWLAAFTSPKRKARKGK